MNDLVVFGGAGQAAPGATGRVTIDGASLGCGMMPSVPRTLDERAHGQAHMVAVRVTAVSCNYRDRTIIQALRATAGTRYSAIGSEFAAEVVAVGAGVTSVRPGDRVIPDHHYTAGLTGADGVREGIATNQASRRLQLLPETKLARIPASMSYEAAAAFSLGAQTAYSMVRRLAIEKGDTVLVTAGGSNTSLFVIGALRQAGATIVATTTSPDTAARLRSAGVAHVVPMPRGDAESGARALSTVADALHGFDAVADPFFDLHLANTVGLLRPFGRYITCGVAVQNAHLRGQAATVRIDASTVMATAIQKNLTIMGNCIGLRTDLSRALHDYESGTLAPVVDSVFGGDEVAPFLDRTYNDPARFGKVVFRYDELN